jgi:hypothetical protein
VSIETPIVDVEQLHVEEDFFLRRDQALCKIETARKNQLIADFVEGNGIAKFLNGFFRFGDSWHVEAHDQLIAQFCRRHESLRCGFILSGIYFTLNVTPLKHFA